MTPGQPEPRELAPIRIAAVNSASSSRGSIHDDEKAREMGYRGGLVPGVTVLGYMSRMMYKNFDDAWTTGGTFHGLLRRPVYEGDGVTVEGVAHPGPDGSITASLRVLDPEGNVCATAEAICAPASGVSHG